MKDEIQKVIELTGATKDRIKLNDDGHVSRVYVVGDGEYIVKFPRWEELNYNNEVAALNYLNTLELPVNIQRVKWVADNHRCIVFHGVKGTPLDKIKNLTTEQKQSIGKQIGAFIKLLHSIKPGTIDIGMRTLEKELQNYNKVFDELQDFFKKYLTPKEHERVNYLAYEYLPKMRRELGEKLVFAHEDIYEPNIIVDENGKVGIIDFGNAGYHEQAVDFGIDDVELGKIVLDAYGADEKVRKKVELKYDTSVLAHPKYHIERHGDKSEFDRMALIVRGIINKYKSF